MDERVASLARALAGRYRVERELGHGGMARVYLTWDIRHERQVALKVLRPEIALLLGVERFKREIATVARLQHPHIMPVHDSGEVDGQLWFTMPFVAGCSLRQYLDQRGPLPTEEALRIIHEAGQGLQFAHSQGVIHRDIKPENLMLTADGSVIVADFGIAKPLYEPSDRLTETGMAVGTPAYMSPEQATGERSMDARTDVYSLGVVLFEMLAGTRPFGGGSPHAILAKKMTAPVPSVLPFRVDLPEDIDRAIQRAIAPDPEDRQPSVMAFIEALERRRKALPRLDYRFAAVLLVAASVLAWAGTTIRGATESRTDTVPVVAVLPLDIASDSGNLYFADGVADGVRARLAAAGGVRVVGTTSSAEFRGTQLTLNSVGQLLGADYAVGGAIKFLRTPGTSGRVELDLKMVRVAGGAIVWHDSFSEPLPGIFEVQAAVVQKIAGVLGLKVESSKLRNISAPLTSNLEAYDAYLKGEEIMRRGAYNAEPWLRMIERYEQAVALDSNFARAWAQLGRAYAISSNMGSTPAESTAARKAAERSIAIAPDQPDGYLALATYFRISGRSPLAAEEQLLIAKRLAPNNVDVLRNLAFTERFLGHWDQAVAQLRLAVQADPRSIPTASELARTLLYLRDYQEVLKVCERAIPLAPNHLALRQYKIMAFLGQGDLPGARRALAEIPPEVSPTQIVSYLTTFYFLYWVLSEDQQSLLLRLSPRQFSDNRGDWGLTLAAVYSDRGDMVRSRAYADSALQAVLPQWRAAPHTARLLTRISGAYGYLGQKKKVVDFGKQAITAAVSPEDANYYRHQLAASAVAAGEFDVAIDNLGILLADNYYLSKAWLRIDPAFTPLKGNPRFEKLLTEP